MKTTITITTKKNVTVDTKWSVVLERPYHYIERNGWSGRNDSAITRRAYKCNLLRSDIETNFDTRKDHAGWDGNPGSITFRGNDLGEMTLTIERNSPNHPKGAWGFYASVRGFERTTKTENDFIETEILPKLSKFIEENANGLFSDAKELYESCLKREVENARKMLAELESKIPSMVEAFGVK